MYYMIIELLDSSYREDIFLALQSVGITSASYTESRNAENYLSAEAPLFTGFFKTGSASGAGRAEEALIGVPVESKEVVGELLQNLREADIAIDEQGIIRVLLVPLALYFDAAVGLKTDGQ